MPRISARQKAVERARRLFGLFVRLYAVKGDSSSGEDEGSVDDDSCGSSSGGSSSSELQALLGWSFARLRRKENSRYEERLPYRSHKYASPQYERNLTQPQNE